MEESTEKYKEKADPIQKVVLCVDWMGSARWVLCRHRLLLCFRQLAHGAQAAGANVDIAGDAIDFKAATMHIQHEAAAGAFL